MSIGVGQPAGADGNASGRSTASQRMRPLSTPRNPVSSPSPRPTIVASGCLLTYRRTSSSKRSARRACASFGLPKCSLNGYSMLSNISIASGWPAPARSLPLIAHNALASAVPRFVRRRDLVRDTGRAGCRGRQECRDTLPAIARRDLDWRCARPNQRRGRRRRGTDIRRAW